MNTQQPSRMQEYNQGTQRACDPEETLRKIMPIMADCGITRVFDVTHLDRIGIPTYNAVRPNGLVLSISNGKGWTKAAASVSAIMESIEIEHSEYPITSNWRLSTSERALQLEGLRTVEPWLLILDCLWPKDEYGGFYYSKDLILDWVEGTELISGASVMLPASTIYVRPPFIQYFTSNGLASGNTFAEATLHAICEIVERDAIARLVGRSKGSPPSGLHLIGLESMPKHLTNLTECITSSGIEMILLGVPSQIDIYTFWSIFYSPGEPNFILSYSIGYGTHTDPVIAASRAITEAAQSRLTHIHGAREDLGLDHTNKQLTEAEQAERRATQTRTMDKIRRLPAYTWDELLQTIPHRADGMNIQASLDMVLEMLKQSGRNQVFVHDLTKPNLGIPVSKVFIPGLKISMSMI